ncbi:MAG: RdgB/HAM1 family non-canonical purine NTP pyrophosphatase [Elusimicrobiaceae bacterium]|nr:RdgB/HAM1 family non-canonical purine NTP pyrophosphatase [Elusimicrobiaceae bacterium]
MKILVATGNKHKFQEITNILPRQTKKGENIDYVGLQDIGGLAMPEENGKTLQENAELKAIFAAKESGLWTIADDTGLEVEFLNGRPGVHTARYAGKEADTQANNQKLLMELEGLFLGKRSARFRTIATLATPQGQIHSFEGILNGFIGFDYRGTNGFGYDPLFIVEGSTHTLAQLSEEEKNKISHRAKAFEKLAKHLDLL